MPDPSASLVAWSEEAEAAAGIARSLAGTAFVPASLKIFDERNNLDFDATVAQVTAALLTGQELGLHPMASLRSIDVIPPGSGSPALRAAAARGLLQQHGHEIWVVEQTETRAVVRGRRAGSDQVMESKWTIDRARKMRLRGFGNADGNWVKQPATMLVARATAEMARWIGMDVLLGLPYLVEEIEDAEDGDGDRPALKSGTARRTPAGSRARGTSRARVSAVSPAGALPAAPLPANPPGEQHSAPDAADDGAPAAQAKVKMINPGQRAALWAGMRELGVLERGEALETVSRWVGRPIGSSNELTSAEASDALEALTAEKTRRAMHDQDSAGEAPDELPPDEEQPNGDQQQGDEAR